MTLTVDAAGAAFNSSIATVSVKPASRRFWPPFCDREYFCFSDGYIYDLLNTYSFHIDIITNNICHVG